MLPGLVERLEPRGERADAALVTCRSSASSRRFASSSRSSVARASSMACRVPSMPERSGVGGAEAGHQRLGGIHRAARCRAAGRADPAPLRVESVRAARAWAARTVVSCDGFSTSCLTVSIGVSLRRGTSNCCAHWRTERRAWGAKPSPSTGRAGGLPRRCRSASRSAGSCSTTNFFSASAKGLSLSRMLGRLDQVPGGVEGIGDLQRAQVATEASSAPRCRASRRPPGCRAARCSTSSVVSFATGSAKSHEQHADQRGEAGAAGRSPSSGRSSRPSAHSGRKRRYTL